MANMEIDKMKVQNYMTSNPITVQQDISISDAISIMASKRIGNLIVKESSSGPVGLLTERELIGYLSLNGQVPNLPLNDLLVYQPFNGISPDTSILDAANTMISMKTRLLVFDGDNKLVGIITTSDMVRAFSKTRKNPSLEHAMNNKIIDVQFNVVFLMQSNWWVVKVSVVSLWMIRTAVTKQKNPMAYLQKEICLIKYY